ncbi:hypothetical protein C8R43DRAFT_949319 [Mycena crocata]|nr:hypothetical protein C8R43DRAFT_949319 [Mycena crocata]
MATPFLAVYIANQSNSMAFATHTVHFLPTRHCTLDSGGLFTYKDLGTTVMPSGSRRGLIPRFSTDIFGELFVMEELPENLGFIFGFRCPENATCSAAHVYWEQIIALQKGCVCVGSWFALPSDGVGDFQKGECYILVKARTEQQCNIVRRMFDVGKLLKITVTMERSDLAAEGKTEREYRLIAKTLAQLDITDIPHKSVASSVTNLVNPPGSSPANAEDRQCTSSYSPTTI